MRDLSHVVLLGTQIAQFAINQSKKESIDPVDTHLAIMWALAEIDAMAANPGTDPSELWDKSIGAPAAKGSYVQTFDWVRKKLVEYRGGRPS